jgi:hypothetical protein
LVALAKEPQSKKPIPKTFRLEGIDPEEVSIVKQPAIRRGFFLLKEEDGKRRLEMDAETIKAILETKLPEQIEKGLTEAMEKAKLSESAKAAINAALKTLQVHKDEIPADLMKKLAAMAGVGFPGAKPGGAAGDDDKDKDKKFPFEKSIEGLSDEDRERIAKQFEAEKAEREKIQKQLDEEKNKRIAKEYVEKAAPYKVPHFPADKLGPMLRTIDEVYGADSDQAKDLAALCKTVTESEALQQIMVEKGTTGSGEPRDAAGKLDALARKRVEVAKEAGRDLTYEQAYDEAMQESPELYDEIENSSR